MFNGGAINGFPINSASSGVLIVGSGLLIEIEQSVSQVESGNLVSIEQTVGYVGSGLFINVEQDVMLYMTGQGLIIGLPQEVNNSGVGRIINIEQRVVDTSIADHVTRTGWDVVIVLDGNIIPSNQIHGEISVTRSESQASLAEFTIIPPIGLQSVSYYAGKTVTIDVLTPTGTKRIYTGVVDIPVLDLVNKKIAIRCTDRRTELVNAQLGSVVRNIGYFSPIVFQTVKDTAEELDKRLSTTPYSVDFDVFGNYTLTSWFPKATADYTLVDSDIYLERPTVELSSRGRITNKVNIQFQYRYERLHHMQREFLWTSPITESVFQILTYGYSLTKRADIVAAIEGANWPVRGDVSYTAIWPSGWYGSSSTGLVAWFIRSNPYEFVPVKDSLGQPVLDASGNPVMAQNSLGGTNVAILFCMGANWDATTRWTQTVTEDYNLSVIAPQSITQYGTIEQDETYSTSADFNAQEWEQYERYDNIYDKNTDSYYVNKDTNRLQFNSAVATALNKARTTILASHRDTKVNVRTFLFPEIDLKHTLEVDTDLLQSKGKVFSIEHRMDVGTGEAWTAISISLFKSQGSSSDTALVAPTLSADTVNYPTGTIVLGNHFGEDPTTLAALSWNGMVGNRRFSPLGPLTTYQEQFIVDTPAIPDGLRTEKVKSTTNNFNVNIPDDGLTIVF